MLLLPMALLLSGAKWCDWCDLADYCMHCGWCDLADYCMHWGWAGALYGLLLLHHKHTMSC